MNNRIYLVTGAAGFLGSNICRQLTADGQKVRALVLEGDPAAKYIPEGVEITWGDLLNIPSLERFFDTPAGIDVYVIHSASIVWTKMEENPKVRAVNVDGTANIIDQCIKHKVKKLVYISSFGAIPEAPHGEKIKEVDNFEQTEGLVGFYSVTKAEATQLVLNAVKEHPELDASVIHPTGICGPYDYAFGPVTSMVMQFIKGEMKMGISGTFNSVDVRDLAAGVIAACDKGRRGECYILSNMVVTMNDMFEYINKAAGTSVKSYVLSKDIAHVAVVFLAIASKFTGKDPLLSDFNIYMLNRNNECDCSKAEAELGYKCRPFEETMQDTVDWLEKEGFIEIRTDEEVKKENPLNLLFRSTKNILYSMKEGFQNADKPFSAMSPAEKMEYHRKMAETYHDAYARRAIDEKNYQAWVMAPHAQFWSPYFGDKAIDLDEGLSAMQEFGVNEAVVCMKAMPDYSLLGFKSYPSEAGFAMQVHLGGHDAAGQLHDYYAYQFVDTNASGEITRWETHVSPEYNDFLDHVLGIHGPFKDGLEAYNAAAKNKMTEG